MHTCTYTHCVLRLSRGMVCSRQPRSFQGVDSHGRPDGWTQGRQGRMTRQVRPSLYLTTLRSHCPSGVRGRNFLPLQYIIFQLHVTWLACVPLTTLQDHVILTTQMWSCHLSKTNKTFVDVQPSKPLIGQKELQKQLTYVSRVCKGLYFIFPSKQSPSKQLTSDTKKNSS